MSNLQYEHRPATEAGAKAIVAKFLNQPPHRQIVLVNVGTGGGKTFMAIRALGAYQPQAAVLVLTTKKQVDSHNWEDSFAAYQKAVNSANKPVDLQTYVVNYEAFRRADGYQAFQAWLKTKVGRPLYVIADEAQRIKNPGSKNFKALQKLLKYPYYQGLIGLSATPITESLLDTQSYLILAGYYTSRSDFRRRHVTRLDPYFQPMIKDRQGVIHNEWLRDYKLIIERFKSIQVYIDTDQLKPPVTVREWTFRFDAATQAAYRQIAKDYRNGVYDSIASAIAAQRTFVANHSHQRLQFLYSIIDSPDRPQGPVLIFYQYNDELAVLKQALTTHYPNRSLYEINGQSHYDVRQTPPDDALFLCQYQAAGEGLNAQWSRCTIFFAPTYSYNNYQQAQGRNVRAYQTGTVYQIRFVVRNTINEHYWYDLIDNKRNFTEQLMADYLTRDD